MSPKNNVSHGTGRGAGDDHNKGWQHPQRLQLTAIAENGDVSDRVRVEPGQKLGLPAILQGRSRSSLGKSADVRPK